MTDPWSVKDTKEINQKGNSNELKVNSNQYNISEQGIDSQTLGFEDSFIQDNNSNTLVGDNKNSSIVESDHQPLPDSQIYLQNLERKLEKLKNSSKLVDALSEKRDECLRSMLQNNSSNSCNNEQLLELEASVANTDSAVQNLYRQIQPVQPVTIGETVHIVQYDQLEEQRLETEAEVSKEETQEKFPTNH